MKRVDVVIYRAERTNNSHDGNPGWKFHTNAGVYRMTTDASLGYAVENYVWSQWRADRHGPTWHLSVAYAPTGFRSTAGRPSCQRHGWRRS